MQKFKRGNLVEILVGHQIWSNKDGVTDISPNDIGKKAIIEYSYAEKFGGTDVDSYSIIWMDTGGSLAWKKTDEMRLLDEGGDYLFEQASANRKKISEQNKDIGYIEQHLDEGNLSSESILFLFDLLEFKSSFLINGEFYSLFNDWRNLHPIFVHIKNAKTIDEAKEIFKPAALLVFNVEKVYDAFHK